MRPGRAIARRAASPPGGSSCRRCGQDPRRRAAGLPAVPMHPGSLASQPCRRRRRRGFVEVTIQLQHEAAAIAGRHRVQAARPATCAVRSRDRAPGGFVGKRISCRRCGQDPRRHAAGLPVVPMHPGRVGVAAMPPALVSQVCRSDDSAAARGRRDRGPAPATHCSTNARRVSRSTRPGRANARRLTMVSSESNCSRWQSQTLVRGQRKS